jgi:hypothetical protein
LPPSVHPWICTSLAPRSHSHHYDMLAQVLKLEELMFFLLYMSCKQAWTLGSVWCTVRNCHVVCKDCISEPSVYE